MGSEAYEQTAAAFIEQLCNTDFGLVIAANMLDSCNGEGPLVNANFVRAFLAECAVLAAGVTVTDCPRIVDEVATGFGPSRRSCPSRRSYLRGAARYRPHEDSSYHVSNVLKCETFHRFLLSTKYKGNDDLPEVLPLIPKASPSGEEEYRTILASITSRSAWLAPGAMLGRPFPSSANCWLSTDRFGPDDEAPNYGNDTATKARDELGLIDYTKDTYLNQIRVPEAALTKLPNIEMARPVFSDAAVRVLWCVSGLPEQPCTPKPDGEPPST